MSTNWSDNSGFTHLELHPNGTYKSFVPLNETEWNIGETLVILKGDAIIKFYDNGNVESCFLSNPFTCSAFGTPVIVAEDQVIEFHSNGNLKAFTVGVQRRDFFGRAKPWVYKGKTFKPGTLLELSEDGIVTTARRF